MPSVLFSRLPLLTFCQCVRKYCKLKGWSNMLFTGSQYFEANFQILPLCYFFVRTFFLRFFQTMLTSKTNTNFSDNQAKHRVAECHRYDRCVRFGINFVGGRAAASFCIA